MKENNMTLAETRHAAIEHALKKTKEAGVDLDAFVPDSVYIAPYSGEKSYVLVEIALETPRCEDTYGDKCRFMDELWCNLFNTTLYPDHDHRTLSRCPACLQHFPVTD